MGQTFTPAQCRQMLEEDLLKHADDLACIKVPLGDGQKAALVLV
jgi:lysozyme